MDFAAFGAGVGFPLGIGSLVIETRYLLGLYKWSDEVNSDDSIKNTGFGMSIGFTIPLFGLKAGINLTGWKIIDNDGSFNLLDVIYRPYEAYNTFGYQFGGIYEIGVSDFISIQPELLFLQKGVKFIPSGLTSVRDYTISLNYIELPVLMKFKFGDQDKTNFFVTAGPSFGYTASGNTKLVTAIFGGSKEEERDLSFNSDDDGYRRFETSASLGLGLALPIGNGKLVFETRYLLGLSDLNFDDNAEVTMKNRGLSLSAGYMVPLN